jgi:cation:H+ antiporter
LELLINLGWVVIGLAFLTIGGEGLVRGATTLARGAGVTPAVIGLTVVAMGTSMPELTVSLLAALEGKPEIAVANAIGSNIFNVTAVLGITAIIIVIPVRGTIARMEWPFMFAVCCACAIVMLDGRINRLEGTFFLTTLLVFTVYVVRAARYSIAPEDRRELREVVAEHTAGSESTDRRDIIVACALLTAGCIGLFFGGRLLLLGATAIAAAAGMTDRVIGLTVVAAGTGAPELAASVIAARRNLTDVAIGNVIGSNIFNILGILGVSALVRPIPVSREALIVDVGWMIGTTLLLYPILLRDRRISRGEGFVLIAAYVVYLVSVLR